VERVGQVLKNYWVLYYLVFIGFSGFYLWLRWKELPVGNVVDRTGALIGQYGELADVFGAAVGVALFSASEMRNGEPGTNAYRKRRRIKTW
jgi:hypothetical protein